MHEITVCIPSIPPRAQLLARAVKSVTAQTLPAAEIIIALDNDKDGAPKTRQRTLDRVVTPYTAFLDDDDEFYPDHLNLLLDALLANDADLVFPWFSVEHGTDPFPHHFGKIFDNDDPHQVPITFLAKTSSLRQVDGFNDRPEDNYGPTDKEGNRAGEDFRLVCRMCAAGMKIVHVPVRTWSWNHGSGNTSGLPTRW